MIWVGEEVVFRNILMVDYELMGAVLCFALLLFSLPATFILLSRLFKGARRIPPLTPQNPTPELLGSVSVVVPTLNEVERISPCLMGLTRQSYEVREIIIVDSNSEDGTQELVKAAKKLDPRVRLITDSPLPKGWVGRPWALNYGLNYSSPDSEWILGIDADTQPQSGLVAALVQAAQTGGYDVVSLSPQFILKEPGEWWLQPALLMTLLYRFDPAGAKAEIPERVMANGQCFLSRRAVLQEVGGYESAKASFCDDVTLARHIATAGFKVGFLDGAQVIKVRMYEGWRETWREWGRSLDLKDASSPGQLASDLWLLLATQALPLPTLLFCLIYSALGYNSIPVVITAGLNLFLLAIRFALLFAVAPSYAGRKPLYFWLSPFADILAVSRIFLSANQQPTQWRGRNY